MSDSVLFRATRDSARLGVLSDSRLGRPGDSANPAGHRPVALATGSGLSAGRGLSRPLMRIRLQAAALPAAALPAADLLAADPALGPPRPQRRTAARGGRRRGACGEKDAVLWPSLANGRHVAVRRLTRCGPMTGSPSPACWNSLPQFPAPPGYPPPFHRRALSVNLPQHTVTPQVRVESDARRRGAGASEADAVAAGVPARLKPQPKNAVGATAPAL